MTCRVDWTSGNTNTKLNLTPFSRELCFLFQIFDKSKTSCYHLVTRLMRPTDLQQAVSTTRNKSARNKLLTC